MNKGWRLDALVTELAELSIDLQIAADDGRIDEDEQTVVIGAIKRLRQILPDFEQAVTVQQAIAYMEKHNTLDLPYRLKSRLVEANHLTDASHDAA